MSHLGLVPEGIYRHILPAQLLGCKNKRILQVRATIPDSDRI